MTFKHTMSVIDITRTKSKLDKYNATIHNKIGKLWSDAVMAFVESLATDWVGGNSPGVHIETGMSAASTLPVLAKLDKFRKTARFRASLESHIKSKRTLTSKGGAYSPAGEWHPATDGYTRSFEEGIKQGNKGTKVSFGTYKRPLFQFHFDIQPYQWQGNEANWKGLTLAQDAFRDLLVAKIPLIFDDAEFLSALTPEYILK